MTCRATEKILRMKVRIVTNDNTVILEHGLEGNGHEQIHSRKIATDTKSGRCQFQIVDTGGCLLWLGEFTILNPFNVEIDAENEGLHLSCYWPEEMGRRFSAVFENPLILYHINCITNFGASGSLNCDGGKGRLLLICYRKDFGGNNVLYRQGKHSSLTNDEKIWRADQHEASVLEHILFYPVTTSFRQEYLRIKSEELFLLYAQAYAAKKDELLVPDEMIEKMQKADQLISKDIDKSYSIEELARLLLLNTAKLQRYFKIYFGCTIHQYILSVKMKAAQQLLHNSDKTSKEIAFDLGYKSDANFSEAFKKYYGYPPGQLRKKK